LPAAWSTGRVTSPTGWQEVARFDGIRLEAHLWDAIEARMNR
jgi:glutathione synthase